MRCFLGHVFVFTNQVYCYVSLLNEFKLRSDDLCLNFDCSQEHFLVAERGSEENFEHGTSEEAKDEIEVLIHEEPKQTYDGDRRRTIVKNESYGEPECFYGRLQECASSLRRVRSLLLKHKGFEKIR